MKTTVKQVAIVAAGVMLAGLVMYTLRDNDFVDNIRNGFDT